MKNSKKEDQTPKPKQAITELDELRKYFEASRAHFPYFSPITEGGAIQKYLPAPSTIRYSELTPFVVSPNIPLIQGEVDQLNKIGHHINENAIIRLSAVLKDCKIYADKKKRNPQITKHEYIEVTRRIRNAILYKNDETYQEALDQYLDIFHLDIPKGFRFHLGIDTVVRNIFDNCREYLINLEMETRKLLLNKI